MANSIWAPCCGGAASADPLDDRFPSGSKDSPREVPVWKAERGRYRLIAARACPWAHRTIIFRRLKGLEDVLPGCDSKSLYDLFPVGPAKQAAKVAGLPQPLGKGGY